MVDQDGYVKIWRRLRDNPIWKGSNQNAKVLMIHVIMSVNWKSGEWTFDGTPIAVLPGQWITTAKRLSADISMSRQEIRTAMSWLEKSHFLTTESTNHYTTITLYKWDTYQNESAQHNQQVNQPLTNGQPTVNQPLTTIKECKKVRTVEGEEENQPRTPRKRGGKEPMFSFIAEFAAGIVARHPAHGCGQGEAEKLIEAILKEKRAMGEEQALELCEKIDLNHQSWCKTDDWSRGFSKGLANWLAPTMDRYMNQPGAMLFGSNGNGIAYEDKTKFKFVPVKKWEPPAYLSEPPSEDLK